MVTPSIRNTPLKKTKRGYLRQLGSLSKGSSKLKFYLGHDMAIAAQRRQWIEAIYIECCRMCGHACWSEPYLGFARQIERHGSAVFEVERLPVELSYIFGPLDHSFIQRLRDAGVPISIIGEPAKANVTLPSAVATDGKPAVTKLHEAIREFQANRVKNYPGGYQGAQRLEKQIEKFLEIDDCWLFQLDYLKIKNFIDFWRGRPKTGHGKRCSKTYAENQIGEFIKFLDYIEAAKPNEFSCPKLSSIDRTVKRLSDDAIGNAIEDKFWSPDELRDVFKCAGSPLSRLLIGLGLNACSGAAELGRIRIDDFRFGCKHPHHKIIRYTGEHDWLITVRQKAFTHSEALLWPWVSELVQAQIEICRKNGWPYLFTEDGEPMYRDNAMYEEVGLPLPNTTKPESRFVKRYNTVVNTAHRLKLIEKKRSLGKLRKTFSNYLTLENHADLATLALAHLTDEDQLLKHYANKPYARLFRATVAAETEWNLTLKRSDSEVTEQG